MDERQRAIVLLDQVNEIAQTLVAEVWQQLPGYDDVRMDMEDLAGVVAPNIEVLLRTVADHRRPRPDELSTATALGQRRAIQGVPIEAVVASWHRAEREVLTRLTVVGPPLTSADHRQMAATLAIAVDTMTAVSTDAYRRTRNEAAGHLEQIATDLVSRLAGDEPMDLASIEERARLVGVAAQTPHRAVALGTDSDDPLVLARAQRTVLDTVHPRLHSRALVGSRGGQAITVLPEMPDLTDMLARAVQRTATGNPFVMGVGLPRARFGEASGSCREAMAALEVGLRRGPGPELVQFESIVADVLLIENPLDARQVVQAALGPLLARPPLIETLRCYLHVGLSIRATAAALALHENTVAYRLRRIIEALGIDRTADLVRTDILMALRTLQLATDQSTNEA